MPSKEIILEYNDYKIKLEIEDNYESAIKAIKKKLYFKDKDLEKVSIFYYDEDNLENDVDEDSFDEAYESGKWGIRRKDEDEENNEAEEKEDKKGISEDQLKEEKEKLEKELKKKIQKEVNEKVKQKLEELKNKFKKIANEKISANNSKYEKKIKDLNDIIKQLIEKNKAIIEENNKIQKSSIEKIIEYAEQKISNQMEQLNSNFTENINSQLSSSVININTKNKTIDKEIKALEKNQTEMAEIMNNCKNNFRDIYMMASKKNINGNK